MNPVKTTIDLSYLDRFDAVQTAAEIKIGTTGVFFKGLGEKIPSRKAALFAGKPGKDSLVIAVQESPDGFEIKESSRGTRCCCSRFVRALLDRGVELPQTADLAWDTDTKAFTARLKLIVKPQTPGAPPQTLRRRPRKDDQGC